MEILEDPAFKMKYQKSKFRVKRWESSFMEKYGRKPNKNDIRAADNTIKESYKMYWKLKTQVLEETLLDITFTDDVQSNVAANTSVNVSFSAENETLATDQLNKSLIPEISGESLCKNAENIDPDKSEILENIKTSVSKDESVNVDGVWGDHLNQDKQIVEPRKKKNLLIGGRSSSFQLSQKMFSTSNLTKRNPRKSLSMTKLKNTKSEQNLNSSTLDTSIDKLDGFDVDPSKSLFGEPIKVVHTDAKVSSQPINAIQQLIKGGTTMINRKFNQGWLDRCCRENGVEIISANRKRLSGTSDSGIESMDLSHPSPPDIAATSEPQKIADISSDEDFVCNSDSEEERRNKRVRNFTKRLSDETSQETKRPRMENHFSFDQTILDKITIGSSSLPEERNPKVENIQINENSIVVNESIKEIHPITNNKITNSHQNKIQKKKSSQIKSKDTKVKTVRGRRKKVEKVTEMASKPDEINKRELKPRAVSRRNYTEFQDDEEEDEELESDEEDFANNKKIVRKKTRVTRSSGAKAKVEETGGAKAKKSRAASARKSVRKKNIESIEEPSEDEIETEDGRKIPIYGIEATEVVPRFGLPTIESGDLVLDFTKSVAPRCTDEIVAAEKSKGPLTDREKLEKKIASGRVNENFVRINIKKKVFVRGKRNFNFSKYKKNQWKQRKKELASGEAGLDLADFAEKNGANTCFKCGGTGHYSRRCTAMKSDDLLPDDGVEISAFPTLEEAEQMAKQKKILAHCSRIEMLPKCPSFKQTQDSKSQQNSEDPVDKDDEMDEDYGDLFEDEFDEESLAQEQQVSLEKLKGHKIPEELLAKLLPPENAVVDAIYDNPTNLPDTPAEVFEALRMFGHETFRPGQEKAVMRILSGQSTLVTLSTGSGKSLCYQLPAYLYAKKSRCITLVVSPLVSLMDDQVVGVPKFLSAAALHTGQSAKVKEKIMETIREGNMDILLVSPEAVVAGEKATGFGALLRQLPPIAFACIDEAHCISQWSHNFRPSYLMICRVLIEKLGVKTILGLTATATKSTAESIVKHLNIRDGLAGVISDTPMPKNLTLTASRDLHRDRALIELLVSERFKECDSIIVYCTRRDECTRIAGIIRVSLMDPKNPEKQGSKCSSIAEAYHAGLAPSRRKMIQKYFMSGKTRVVVATVAFGMGINKTDIRSVIHYNMPASFEGYVQEVGRAGRDNLPAHCHLFLAASKDGDKLELRRHIFADAVDRHMIRRLLQKVFVPCSCSNVKNKNPSQRCPGHEVAIPIDETVSSLDITEETIATLLCYLELHPKRYVTVLSSVYVNAKVSSYGGAKALKIAAQSSPPLAMAIALNLKNGIPNDDNIVEFPVIDVAAAIGWDSGVVKSHLKNLEWTTVDGKSQRSAISVRFDTLGLRVRSPGDLTDAELDEALDALADRARHQESSSLRQLDTIHAALSKYSVNNIKQCIELTDDLTSKSELLKDIIRNYFGADDPLSVVELPPQTEPKNEPEIIGDIRSLISSYRDNNFTGRAVARIFHGIQSPNYPALAWSRCRFWRSHLATDFNFICKLATREILAMQ